jgi:hypothetical protein
MGLAHKQRQCSIVIALAAAVVRLRALAARIIGTLPHAYHYYAPSHRDIIHLSALIAQAGGCCAYK